jgi:hypothetical protein
LAALVNTCNGFNLLPWWRPALLAPISVRRLYRTVANGKTTEQSHLEGPDMRSSLYCIIDKVGIAAVV